MASGEYFVFDLVCPSRINIFLRRPTAMMLYLRLLLIAKDTLNYYAISLRDYHTWIVGKML
jgi:hypothetical protein